MSDETVQDYIFSQAHEDEKKMLLKHKSILGLPVSLIAQQIAARKKAEHKMPLFYQTKGVLYPLSLNLEQSSSQTTARFKAEIIQREIKSENPLIADLTGGFGIDSFFLSALANTLDYVEPSEELSQIVEHNFQVFKKDNVKFLKQTAEQFLNESSGRYNVVYLDPSRRDAKARKVFSLSDCAPNVVELLPDILKLTDFVLLKASPLLDIKQGLRELSQVKKVIVVSVSNECKELLFLIEKNFVKEPMVQTFNLDNNGEVKHAFDFSLSEEEKATSEFTAPQKYLYEPNSSILKTGGFKKIGEKFRVKKIQVNTHLYSSDEFVKDFPGRIFEIEEMDVAAKKIAGSYANIICRNYPLSPEELKKKLKTKDGGEKYLMAFSGLNKKYIVTARRLA